MANRLCVPSVPFWPNTKKQHVLLNTQWNSSVLKCPLFFCSFRTNRKLEKFRKFEKNSPCPCLIYALSHSSILFYFLLLRQQKLFVLFPFQLKTKKRAQHNAQHYTYATRSKKINKKISLDQQVLQQLTPELLNTILKNQKQKTYKASKQPRNRKDPKIIDLFEQITTGDVALYNKHNEPHTNQILRFC